MQVRERQRLRLGTVTGSSPTDHVGRKGPQGLRGRKVFGAADAFNDSLANTAGAVSGLAAALFLLAPGLQLYESGCRCPSSAFRYLLSLEP